MKRTVVHIIPPVPFSDRVLDKLVTLAIVWATLTSLRSPTGDRSRLERRMMLAYTLLGDPG